MRRTTLWLYAVSSGFFACTIVACATCFEPRLVDREKEIQPEQVIKKEIILAFMYEVSEQLMEGFLISWVDVYERAEREVREEVVTCTRQTTGWEEDPLACLGILAVSPIKGVLGPLEAVFHCSGDMNGAVDVKTREKTKPTGRQVESEWQKRRWRSPVEPWGMQPVNLTLRDLDSGHTVWHWEGTTNLEGKLRLSPHDRAKLLFALQGIMRGDIIRGQLLLSSMGLQSELSLAQQQHEVNNNLEALKEILKRH